MMPSLHRRLLWVGLFVLAAALGGCDRPADEDAAPPPPTVKATPAPTPADRAGRRALSAYNAVSQYLGAQDPALRDRLQRAASKFANDKDKVQARLKARQRDLQPRIARLREQVTKAEGKSSDALSQVRQELATLESQRAEAEHKMTELESVTSGTWNSIREGLAGENEPPPAASPSPR